MARLPLRVLGLFLLTVSLTVAGCQAFLTTLHPTAAPAAAQREVAGD